MINVKVEGRRRMITNVMIGLYSRVSERVRSEVDIRTSTIPRQNTLL